MAKQVTITLDEDALVVLKAALRTADALCTSVISGKTAGQMTLALDVARALNDIKRQKVLG
jgi:hypothetical protein